ncbi:glucose-6-phosphate isomerase [Candidatus Parcubacteria bacterium]|nr:glucose-6-phosphate isomerase [Candidatus Parcubacteria bacterium]
MKKVLYDQKWVKTAPNLELYYMHRGIKHKGEFTLLNTQPLHKRRGAAKRHLTGLRYDITIIPARMLGKEFVRTKGNMNSKNFQELYIVLDGKAIFLMQKTKGKIIEDIVVVEAKKGECVIFPPKYAAITINPLKKELKIANWVSIKNKNIYDELGKMGGAGYFYTKTGWIKNKNYKKVPKLRFEKPLKKMPKNLDFLKEE